MYYSICKIHIANNGKSLYAPIGYTDDINLAAEFNQNNAYNNNPTPYIALHGVIDDTDIPSYNKISTSDRIEETFNKPEIGLSFDRIKNISNDIISIDGLGNINPNESIITFYNYTLYNSGYNSVKNLLSTNKIKFYYIDTPIPDTESIKRFRYIKQSVDGYDLTDILEKNDWHRYVGSRIANHFRKETISLGAGVQQGYEILNKLSNVSMFCMTGQIKEAQQTLISLEPDEYLTQERIDRYSIYMTTCYVDY